MSAEQYDSEHPWERQPCDSERSYAIFREFLAAGPSRILGDLRRGRERTLAFEELEGWAREHAWKPRARAWDDEIGRLALGTARDIQVAYARRCAELGHRIVGVASRELAKLEASTAETPASILQPLQVVGYAERGLALEAKALGAPAEQAGPDLSKLSLDEVKAFRELWVKATG